MDAQEMLVFHRRLTVVDGHGDLPLALTRGYSEADVGRLLEVLGGRERGFVGDLPGSVRTKTPPKLLQ